MKKQLRELQEGEECSLLDDISINPLNFKYENYEQKIIALAKVGRLSAKAIISP